MAEAAMKHMLSESTIYVWHKRFGQMEAADVERLKSTRSESWPALDRNPLKSSQGDAQHAVL